MSAAQLAASRWRHSLLALFHSPRCPRSIGHSLQPATAPPPPACPAPLQQWRTSPRFRPPPSGPSWPSWPLAGCFCLRECWGASCQGCRSDAERRAAAPTAAANGTRVLTARSAPLACPLAEAWQGCRRCVEHRSRGTLARRTPAGTRLSALLLQPPQPPPPPLFLPACRTAAAATSTARCWAPAPLRTCLQVSEPLGSTSGCACRGPRACRVCPLGFLRRLRTATPGPRPSPLGFPRCRGPHEPLAPHQHVCTARSGLRQVLQIQLVDLLVGRASRGDG